MLEPSAIVVDEGLKSIPGAIVYLAPRGLITILLFFAIPKEFQNENFNSGILLYTIIVSCIIMAVALVKDGKYRKQMASAAQGNLDLSQEKSRDSEEIDDGYEEDSIQT